MDKDTEPDEDDRALFRRSVAGARPLAHDHAAIPRPRPQPVPVQRRRDERAVLEEMASGIYDHAEIETGEELVFSRPGLQHSVIRRLRRGQYAVEGELDLHGLVVGEAREALFQYLVQAQALGRRCVRIVHGKGLGSRGGEPVLKTKVNLWLRQIDAVLGFCSARPVDGGTGAVYVLLKRG